MLTRIILDYESQPEVVDCKTLSKYDGRKNHATLSSLEAVADTSELSLTWLGDVLPNLEKLHLNNSVIASVRGSSHCLVGLRFLSLAQCGITSLNGIGTISPALEELYLAFNRISDLSELIGLSRLRVLDLDENCVARATEAEFLRCCPGLRALTLAGNPAAEAPTYRADVLEAVS
jgi:Leucine-rich repeat (LRR) protein